MNVTEESAGPQGNTNSHHENTRKEHARWQTNGTRQEPPRGQQDTPGPEEATRGEGARTHTGTLSDVHLQQLRARGLTDETIHAARFWSATTPQEVQALGFPATAVGLVIPFIDPVTHEVVCTRMRPDKPPIKKGKPAKYLSPYKGKNHCYFSPGAAQWMSDASIPVLITEAEIKALWATQVGLPTIGLVGVYGFRGKVEDDEPTGPIPDLDRVTWQGRVVTIVFDSDVRTNANVKQARHALAQELYRRGARVVNAIDLPHCEHGEKQGLDDYLHAHGLAALKALERHTIPSIPTIQITHYTPGMVDAAEAALLKLPGPLLYQRLRTIAQIAPCGPSSRWMQRPPDSPIITPVSVVSLREYGEQAADWKRHDKRTDTWKPAQAPARVFETLAARVQWSFPGLEGIMTTPTLRPDGKLLDTPGYDPETGLFFHFAANAFPPIPAHPSRDDAVAALDELAEPFVDFPFATTASTQAGLGTSKSASKSAAIAGVLTLIARYTNSGNTPLFAVRAHRQGTGKGLLVNTMATMATGRCAATWTQTTNEDEEEKRMLSVGMAGDACMHIDNVVNPLGSAKLDSVLTTGSFMGRQLGGNTIKEVPWKTVIFASGNNMVFLGDMARRVVPIDLDWKGEHPETRTGFKHAPLLDWVQQERPRFVVAALTVLKAFFEAGCPKQKLSEFGSYEQWSRLIRHALAWCDWTDPNEGREHLEEESDVEYEALATLLTCWGECYLEGHAYTLKHVIGDCTQQRIKEPSAVDPANKWNNLWEALSAYDSKYTGQQLDAKRIGKGLKEIEGRVLDEKRLMRRGTYQGAAQWTCENLK